MEDRRWRNRLPGWHMAKSRPDPFQTLNTDVLRQDPNSTPSLWHAPPSVMTPNARRVRRAVARPGHAVVRGHLVPFLELHDRHIRAAFDSVDLPPRAWGLMWSMVKLFHVRGLRHFGHCLRSSECHRSLRCSSVNPRWSSFFSNSPPKTFFSISARRCRVARLSVSP